MCSGSRVPGSSSTPVSGKMERTSGNETDAVLSSILSSMLTPLLV